MAFVQTVVLLLFSLFTVTNACIALGCLGVGCLPPPPCLFPPCMRPPIMGCPCGPGLQCVAGGCVMAKARGAKTYHEKDIIDISQHVEDPNSHFLTCCNLLDVPEDCYHMCSYEGYKKDSLLASFSPLSKCPLSALPQIHFCAARGTDHTRCCKEAKIPNTCEVFCDQVSLTTDLKSVQRPGNVTNLNFTHLQCFEKFDHIKGCFLEHSLTEYYEAKHRYREAGKRFY